MKGFSAWLICGAVLSASSAVELPNVQMVDCPDFLGGFDKCMKIKFSYQEEYAGLNEVDGSSEVLVGKLYSTDGEENADSRVSVSIDEGDMYYVMIHDPSDEELYKLKVNIATGEAEMSILPPSVKLDDAIMPEETRALPRVPLERQSAMPAAGFRMKVQPLIDDSWRNQFGSGAVTKLNAVMEHAKTFFKHSSLGTKYELDVQSVHNYVGDMKATGSQLGSLATYVNNGNGMPLANTYPMMVMRDSSGAAGIAYLGTVCGSRRLRVNINEYYGDVSTAEILVHEIGHNLNMRHDFVSISGSYPNHVKTPRTSSSGAACTDVDGYMDYYVNPNKWSPCSVDDITQYYNQIGPNTYSTTCMTLIDDSATTSAPATTTAAPATTTAAPATTTAAPATTTTANPPGPTTTANPGACAVPQWQGDNWCDDENNTPECNYDGGDCCGCNVRTQYCSECECKDPNPECKDCTSTRRCNRWKRRGWCNRSWMERWCQATCELC